jgi:CubicO group peptidase (beta-lactamase class C family)
MTTRKAILALLTIYLAACSTAAPEYVRDSASVDIDRFATRMLNEVPAVPSLAIAVVRDNKVVYRRNPDVGYYMGSTTKAFTALACAILATRGQLDLDAPITKYLPEVRMAAPLDASKLTLRRLLSHTLELSNDPIVFRTAFSGEHNAKMIVSLLDSSKPGKPGFKYDNLGYVVASVILERVTGKPWQKVLDELVFTPLKMDRTTAYMSEAQKTTMAKPYFPNRKGEFVVLDFGKTDQMMHAAGGTVTTADDLAKWLIANVRKEGGGIPRAAFEEVQKMQAPVVTERGEFKSSGYGFGWYQADYKGERALFHGGGYEGWNTLFSFLPDRKIGVGIMTNSSGPAQRACFLLASYIYDRMLDKPDLEKTYDARLSSLKADIDKMMTNFVADGEKRAQRPWMLKHPNAAYVGRYENEGYGTLVIAANGDRLVASLGPTLRGDVEAFIEPESARVELIPGSGEPLRFTFGPDDKVISVKWGDEVFRKVE